MPYFRLPNSTPKCAFSLLEMAIVLVVIGLIVGGVLVGRDLIASGKIQAQTAQINQYDTAVKAFESKFDDLPGDIRKTRVERFGFTGSAVRAGTVSQGDGNGEINGICCGDNPITNGVKIRSALNNGEARWFWIDLSTNSGLIDGSFNSANPNPMAGGTSYFATTNPRMTLILPRSKIADDVFIYTIPTSAWRIATDADKTLFNHFVIASVSSVDGNGAMRMGTMRPGLTALQAYNMDLKTDDGAPQSGYVTARYETWDLFNNPNYLDGVVGASGGGVVGAPGTAATPASANTCYDNGNSATNAAQRYTLNQATQNRNCALMIRFR